MEVKDRCISCWLLRCRNAKKKAYPLRKSHKLTVSGMKYWRMRSCCMYNFKKIAAETKLCLSTETSMAYEPLLYAGFIHYKFIISSIQ